MSYADCDVAFAALAEDITESRRSWLRELARCVAREAPSAELRTLARLRGIEIEKGEGDEG